MKKSVLSILIAMSLILVVGCSDSGNGSSAAPKTKEGVVVLDSLPDGASVTVFADIDGNGVLSDGEPSGPVDADGNYSLAVPKSQYDNVIMRAVVSNNGAAAYVLSTPAGQAVISPLTTMIYKRPALQESYPDAFDSAEYSPDTLNAARCVAESLANLAQVIADNPNYGLENMDSCIDGLLGLILDSLETLQPIKPESMDLDALTVTIEELLAEGIYSITGNIEQNKDILEVDAFKIVDEKMISIEKYGIEEEGGQLPNNIFTSVASLAFDGDTVSVTKNGNTYSIVGDEDETTLTFEKYSSNEIKALKDLVSSDMIDFSKFTRLNGTINFSTLTVVKVKMSGTEWEGNFYFFDKASFEKILKVYFSQS